MKHQSPGVGAHQAEYARLRALIDIRLAELTRALDVHERVRSNWQHLDPLASINRKIDEALACLQGRDTSEKEMFGRYRRLRAAVARRVTRSSTKRSTQRELRQS